MSGLFGNLFSKSPTTTQTPAFGYTVSPNSTIAKSVEEVQSKVKKNSANIRSQFAKFQELNKFTKQLSDSYIGNLEVMVDISKLINYYGEVFNVLNQELSKNIDEFSSVLKPADLSYLENLTRSEIDKLNNTFFGEAAKVKKLYQNFGKNEELNRVERAENQIRTTSTSAEAVRTLVNSPSSFAGGKKRRGLPRYKKKVYRPKRAF